MVNYSANYHHHYWWPLILSPVITNKIVECPFPYQKYQDCFCRIKLLGPKVDCMGTPSWVWWKLLKAESISHINAFQLWNARYVNVLSSKPYAASFVLRESRKTQYNVLLESIITTSISPDVCKPFWHVFSLRDRAFGGE